MSGPTVHVHNKDQLFGNLLRVGTSGYDGTTDATVNLKKDGTTDKFTIVTDIDEYLTFTVVCPEEYSGIDISLTDCTEDGTSATCTFAGTEYKLEGSNRPIGSGALLHYYYGDMNGALETANVEVTCFNI